MHVYVQRPSRQNQLLPGHYFGSRADDHLLGNARHNVRVASLADPSDAPVLDADIGFVNARVVEHQCVGDYQVQCLFLVRAALLSHTVAQHFAAAKLALLAVHGVILLDLDDQIRVAQPHPVAGGGAVHIRISASINNHIYLTSFNTRHQP